jgi:hypothetical protein
MGVVRDTWRAVLALVVGVLLLEAAGLRRQPPPPAVATPTVTTNWQPAVIHASPAPQPQPERPLRRVASAVMEVGDSVIGVFR